MRRLAAGTRTNTVLDDWCLLLRCAELHCTSSSALSRCFFSWYLSKEQQKKFNHPHNRHHFYPPKVFRPLLLTAPR